MSPTPSPSRPCRHRETLRDSIRPPVLDRELHDHMRRGAVLIVKCALQPRLLRVEWPPLHHNVEPPRAVLATHVVAAEAHDHPVPLDHPSVMPIRRPLTRPARHAITPCARNVSLFKIDCWTTDSIVL